MAAASHLDDLEGLLQVADLHPDPARFGPWLPRALAVERTAGGVTLSTVHRVKGREWPMVAVVGVNGGILPHRLAEGLPSSRRNDASSTSAITRSSTQTVVLFDESRPSPFLGELDGTAPHRPAGVGQDGEVIAAPPVKAEARPSIDAGDPVAAALKAWRSERAAADQVPAYVVMWDQHLAGIAARRPTTKRELAGCPGIGPARLETYGDAILDVIRGQSARAAWPGVGGPPFGGAAYHSRTGAVSAVWSKDGERDGPRSVFASYLANMGIWATKTSRHSGVACVALEDRRGAP